MPASKRGPADYRFGTVLSHPDLRDVRWMVICRMDDQRHFALRLDATGSKGGTHQGQVGAIVTTPLKVGGKVVPWAVLDEGPNPLLEKTR